MKRREDIDILKSIGLICIILAHVNPPKFIFQLRNFDVVLMILVSAYLGLCSTKKMNYFEYVYKRAIRLIIPTWIFLIVFFIINSVYVLCYVDKKTVLSSFVLGKGIGYVWVIRIYFIISALIPICKYLIENFKEKDLIIITIILYFVYEIMCHYGIFNNKLIQYLFAYIIPCFYLTMSSKWIFSTNKKNITIYSLFNLIICVCIGVYIYYKTGEFKNTQIMKYPFRIYYLSYGLCISSILIMILKNKEICSILNTKLIKYISGNSLWIYLWHILFIYVYKIFIPNINWILLFMLLIASSCTIVFVQQKIISIMENKGVDKKILSVFKG